MKNKLEITNKDNMSLFLVLWGFVSIVQSFGKRKLKRKRKLKGNRRKELTALFTLSYTK